jgi:hypothetical protein
VQKPYAKLLAASASIIVFGFLIAGAGMRLCAQQLPVVVDGALTAQGGAPFHLEAAITDGSDPFAEIEMDWLAPNRWRRVIKSQDFSQTLVVDGDRISDQHTGSYMPIALEQQMGVLLDPYPLLALYVPGDLQITKANGLASESGIDCFDAAHRMCTRGEPGLTEQVQILGRLIQFSDYRDFGGKRIAYRIRRIAIGGENQTATILKLEVLKHPSKRLLAIGTPTPAASRFDTEVLPEGELRDLAKDKPDLIWPQVLDGAQTGPASFYIGIDLDGRVREVLPVKTANERSNDSAVAMLSRWSFKPALRDGVPVQAEGVLAFTLNTRAYGPAEPLSDSEARNLATNIVDPVVAPGTVPPGTEFKIWIAVDADGAIIEEIIDDGPPNLFVPVDRALHQWHFKPIMENGKPRPYRALMVFKF